MGVELLVLAAAAAMGACDITLKDANVWNGAAYEKQTLSIRNGRFRPADVSAATTDASYLYLTPPFADAHTHTIDEPRGMDDKTHARFLAQGVFYALNPNNIRSVGPTPAAKAGAVELQSTGGGVTRTGGHPQPLYENMASRGWLGPITKADLPGRAFHQADTPEQARAAVRKVKANGAAMIKLYLLHHTRADSGGLSGEAFDAAVDEARKAGLKPIVHVEDAADFRRAVGAKVHAIMHLPYEAPTVDKPAEIYRLTAQDAAAAAQAQVIVVPTATVAAMRYDGARLAETQAILRHNLQLLRAAKVRMAIGADNYSLGMHDEITTLRGLAMFDAAEMIEMATRHGAELAFPGRKLGMLKPDHEASFVGYFFPLDQGWAAQREPVVGMRAGQVMVDTIGFFAKACPAKAAG